MPKRHSKHGIRGGSIGNGETRGKRGGRREEKKYEGREEAEGKRGDKREERRQEGKEEV